MGRSKSDAQKHAKKKKGAIAQAHTIAERAKAKAVKKRKLSDSDEADELEKVASSSESEVGATTTTDSSDKGVVQEKIVEKSKKLKKAQDTIKRLDASIAAQEATNENRLKELNQTRTNYQSEVEVTELYNPKFNLRTMY